MRQELQDRLFKKYPKIFRQKDLSPQETCMCWGIACGDGWYDLIDTLCHCIQGWSDHIAIQVEAEQVKSKFGGLRFYTNASDPRICGMIQMAEAMSHVIDEGTDPQRHFRRRTESAGELNE